MLYSHDSVCFRKMGAGPISICLDRAPVHTAGVSRKKLEELFDNVYFQTPKSPDLSMCDAGVFPWMEREQQRKGAVTTEQIRASVMATWRALKPEMLKKVANRVRANATKVVELKGGNFYDE